MIRGVDGHEITIDEAKELVLNKQIEVGYTVLPFDGNRVIIRSRLQPISHGPHEPLYLTTVLGDVDLGMQEYGHQSEEQCRQFHKSIVDRYQVIECARVAGTPKVLIEGVL